MNKSLFLSQDKIAAFCEKHHISNLALFGSILRDDFRADSDVLVEFEIGYTPGFFAFDTIFRHSSRN